MHLFISAFSCIVHVDHVAQEYVAVEVEEAEAEGQEEPQQKLEVAAEDQELATNFVNPEPQPGKHRFIYPRVLLKFKFGASTGSSIPVSYLSLILVQAPKSINPEFT